MIDLLHHSLHNYYFNQGLQNVREGSLEVGKDGLLHALTFYKEDKSTWNLLGLTYYRLGRYGSARYCWNKSLDIEKDRNPAVGYLKDLEEELAVLQPFIDETVHYVKAKKYKKAIKMFDKIPKRISKSVDILNYFGIICCLNHDMDGAREFWIQSLQLSKTGKALTYLTCLSTSNNIGRGYWLKQIKGKLGL